MSRLVVSRRRFLTASGAVAAGATLGRISFAEEAPDAKTLAAGNARFGCDLYGKLSSSEGNLFFSPFSISTALAMTAAGAKGQTHTEMMKTLHLPENPHPAFATILKSINEEPPAGKSRGFQLTTANALWAQQGYPWRADYKALVTASYLAALNDVDYKANPEAARSTINRWVEKETRDKIKELIPSGTITKATRLVLTNAIYFKGEWISQFRKEATKDQPFHLTSGKTETVPLMHRIGDYLYSETDTYQTIQLPYTGRRIGMVIVLPKKPDMLPAVEKQLTADHLAAEQKKMRMERDVRLFLPRFKVERAFQLNDPLTALGMKAAFGQADFGGMHTGDEHLNISAVIHKAFVDVNEEGTEAAAATGVVMKATSMPVQPKEPKVFRADRPFLFLIRDTQTDSVLFLGRVTNPKA